MDFIFQPWQLLVIIIAGWINREQQEVIDYHRAEIKVLRQKLGKGRILLNDDQRRLLAVKGKVLGRKRLKEVGTLFSPDTILRWHRMLVAKKWDYSQKRKPPGRPPFSQEIVELVIKFAKENTTWGYDRIQGALANLGHTISDQSIGNILKRHGIEPSPERKANTSWSTFVKAHWEVLSAIDFTTIEVWTKHGLTTFYLLFAIELKSRRICFAGCTTNPIEPWMLQIARNLTDCEDGSLRETKYLLLDRDAIFTQKFRDTLESAGVKPLRLPARTPNLNAWIERFHRTIKSECLERMIFFGEESLRKAVGQFLEHYHTERNHQGLENSLIDPDKTSSQCTGLIECRERLGGILRYYHRTAA